MGVGQPADLMTRFLARLIDFILLAVVNTVIVVTLIIGAIFGNGTGMTGTGGGFAAGAIATIISTALYIGYFAFLESNRGQTLGKMFLKLQVQGPGGGNPTMEQALRRNSYLALNLIAILPVIGWLIAPLAGIAAAIYIAVTINNNAATRQGWHDEFAGGTKVIKIG